MAATMQYRLVSGIYVVVHGKTSPSDREWATYCEALSRDYDQIKGQLIFVLGGEPSAQQRSQVREVWNARKIPPMAILTQSVIARGVVTALNWFLANKLRAFPLDNVGSACDFLGVASADCEALLQAALEMFDNMSLPAPPSLTTGSISV